MKLDSYVRDYYQSYHGLRNNISKQNNVVRLRLKTFSIETVLVNCESKLQILNISALKSFIDKFLQNKKMSKWL